MYDVKSMDANEFICHDEVIATLAQANAEASDPARIAEILAKAK